MLNMNLYYLKKTYILMIIIHLFDTILIYEIITYLLKSALNTYILVNL